MFYCYFMYRSQLVIFDQSVSLGPRRKVMADHFQKCGHNVYVMFVCFCVFVSLCA